MRLSVAAAVAGLCASSHAFSDSSPFILYSTAKLSKPTNQGQLQSSAQVIETTKQLLSSCPTNRYLFISQPNLNAAHLSSVAVVPKLTESINDATSSYSIAEVAGEFDVRSIATYVRETCELPQSSINVVELLPLPSSAAGSETAVKEHDDEVGMILEQYATSTGESFTVVYTGGARTEKPQTYTAEFTDSGAGHTELKRQLHDVRGIRRQENNNTKLPLFEKYQYFTPGIFMGLIALVVLMSILYGGISALASLQVSYGAFDKEMGPAAQKKQQ
ncbi:ER protein BIG1 [Xylaria arbuscula]|nr:ER protein BIG1 [Xylaria arbuscula]